MNLNFGPKISGQKKYPDHGTKHYGTKIHFWKPQFYGLNYNFDVILQKCPFRKACLAGDTEKMKDLYEKNQNIELHVDRSGWNGLHHASAAGQIKESFHNERACHISSAAR